MLSRALDRLRDFWVWTVCRRIERGDELWIPRDSPAWLHEVTFRYRMAIHRERVEHERTLQRLHRDLRVEIDAAEASARRDGPIPPPTPSPTPPPAPSSDTARPARHLN